MAALMIIAWHLAISWKAEHRWRRLALPASAFLATLIICGTVSVLNAFQHQDHREWGRSFRIDDTQDTIDLPPSALYVSGNADYWHGNQFLQYWIAPVSGEVAALPPGMYRMPQPGEAAVSPALADEMERSPELRARYPDYFVMSKEGMADRGELMAWVRPTSMDQFLQRDPWVVTAFNADSANPIDDRLSMGSPVRWRQLLIAATGLILIPSVLLLLLGMSSASALRDQRFQLLGQLGASRRWLFGLAVIETAIAAFPIAVTTVLVWWALSGMLDVVPFLGKQVFVGDMALQSWQAALILAGLLLLIIISAALQTVLPTLFSAWRRFRGSRIGGIMIGIARVLPLLIALVLSFQVATNESEAGILAYLLGVAITLAVMPSVVTQLGEPLGRVLSASSRLGVHLAGSRLRHHPAAAMRPFIALASIVVVLLTTLAIIAFMTDRMEYVDRTASPSSAVVLTTAPLEETAAALQAALPDALILPMAIRSEGELDSNVNREHPVVGSSCEQVAVFLAVDGSPCVMDGPPTLKLFGTTFYVRDGQFEPGLAFGDPDVSQLMVISHRSMEQIDTDVRAALPVADYPWLRVRTPESFTIKASPAVPWVQRGTLFFVGLAGTAVIATLVDQMVSRAGNRRMLVALGASPRRVASVELTSFAVPYLAAIVAGIVVGVLQSLAFKRLYPFDWPVGRMLLMIGLMLAVGVIAGGLVGWLSYSTDTDRARAFTNDAGVQSGGSSS